jgi:hypothetical protein
MIPAPEVQAICLKCGTALNFFSNVTFCPNCGQTGRSYQGNHCPNGCDRRLTIEVAGRRHCNQCSASW